ncbi:MAG: aspartate--tRNA ligase [SAR202 cluster bacterium]|nr:aspartate--tRNA ligase [SAR202 cluster bacterium]
MHKSIDCGSLRKTHLSQDVILAGWVHRRRDHGNIIFLDLRDRSGLIQLVFDPKSAPQAHNIAESVRNEWVLKIKGVVSSRPEGTVNPDMPTGDVEILANDIEIMSRSKTPPFYINEESDVDESIRLRYRYMDLRRPFMQEILILRHKVVKFIRDFLDNYDFIEIETPILIKSTPEGARDYIVPSRVHPGMFYALPQSPQQLKQLLMASGFEKYFQIARCFRDEDLRADRQPEHTQLDLEMSFVHRDDVLSLIEELMINLVESIIPDKKINKPFPKITYHESMDRYGTDKPDLRFGLEIIDITKCFITSDFQVFRTVIEDGGVVQGIVVPGQGNMSRKKLDKLVEQARQLGAQGLVWIGLPEELASEDHDLENTRSSISKYITQEELKKVVLATKSSANDLLLIVSGEKKLTQTVLGQLRSSLGLSLELVDQNQLEFAFIIDFPLFEPGDNEGQWTAAHHAFTMPKEGQAAKLETDPGSVIADSYDLVCNGLEIASGSIRVHDRELQERILKVLGYSLEQINERFGQLLESFDYGAPPHGGIAPGIDRLVMVLAGLESIRDTIAFPKTQSAVDPLFGSPGPVEDIHLDELKIRVLDNE